MSIVHITTEVSGGAGVFARSVHLAMQELGMASLLITRERNDLENTAIIKPLTRLEKSLRARKLKLLGKLGLIDNKYATFGIEKSSVEFRDIKQALGTRTPKAFIFYWVSYFVSFKCMSELRQAYPDVPLVFICMDEGFLGGGCHYSWGCNGFEGSCNNCPSTSLPFRKRRIERELCHRLALIHAINPIVLYPTTIMAQMGKKSAILKNLRSEVIPLGAISSSEQSSARLGANQDTSRAGKKRQVLLIRSSSEYRKGCDLFVAAIKTLSEKMPNLRERLEVISIGDATLKNARISDYVNHTDFGLVQRKGLIAIYEKIDVLIVTSREDAGPLMINECIALGKYVISTPVGVAHDLISDVRRGIILQDCTSEAICNSLTLYCENQLTKIREFDTAEDESYSLTFEGYIKAVMNVISAPHRELGIENA